MSYDYTEDLWCPHCGTNIDDSWGHRGFYGKPVQECMGCGNVVHADHYISRAAYEASHCDEDSDEVLVGLDDHWLDDGWDDICDEDE